MYPFYSRQDQSVWASIEDLPNLVKQQVLLIDLRRFEDFNQFHIPGFISKPYRYIRSWLPELNLQVPVYFICTHGQTAYELAYDLRKKGYQSYAFIGGINYYLQLQKPNQHHFF